MLHVEHALHISPSLYCLLLECYTESYAADGKASSADDGSARCSHAQQFMNNDRQPSRCLSRGQVMSTGCAVSTRAVAYNQRQSNYVHNVVVVQTNGSESVFFDTTQWTPHGTQLSNKLPRVHVGLHGGTH